MSLRSARPRDTRALVASLREPFHYSVHESRIDEIRAARHGAATAIPVLAACGGESRGEAGFGRREASPVRMAPALQAGGSRVEVEWTREDGHLDVVVRDDGRGLPDSGNLFVPFFPTKPNGSGIGLALSRQIAEGHGGTLTQASRRDGKGCEARVSLPLGG